MEGVTRAGADAADPGTPALAWLLSPAQRLRHFSGAVDEELRRRTEHSVVQGENSDRSADDRQFDRQFFDERMPGGEREYGFRVDRKIASGTEKIDDHLQTIGDDRR